MNILKTTMNYTMKKTYRPLPKFLTIKNSSIEGLGLFATEAIIAEVHIGISHVKRRGFEDGYVRTPLGGFINHSETPNCETNEIENGIMEIKSLRDIKPGEELTLKYKWYNPNE